MSEVDISAKGCRDTERDRQPHKQDFQDIIQVYFFNFVELLIPSPIQFVEVVLFPSIRFNESDVVEDLGSYFHSLILSFQKDIICVGLILGEKVDEDRNDNHHKHSRNKGQSDEIVHHYDSKDEHGGREEQGACIPSDIREPLSVNFSVVDEFSNGNTFVAQRRKLEGLVKDTDPQVVAEIESEDGHLVT